MTSALAATARPPSSDPPLCTLRTLRRAPSAPSAATLRTLRRRMTRKIGGGAGASISQCFHTSTTVSNMAQHVIHLMQSAKAAAKRGEVKNGQTTRAEGRKLECHQKGGKCTAEGPAECLSSIQNLPTLPAYIQGQYNEPLPVHQHLVQEATLP
ncbi:hypothetical protein B0H12DRAFT_1082863 [Mycena haematopus]|nr:hypothetical protein B0H12DRAFT_1082863 [Mycena haematopus]